ncbi:MAG: histidine phosphatase family protein [Candidatus Aerophobetes bacterium]|nr:histidine phosphatase family protein [Candidatus Aerophobetes bacterium]
MPEIILVRHGQTDWNRENRIQGGLNIPLNNQGKEEARTIALKLAPTAIHYIYSSKLSRAYATAVEIAKFHKIKVLTDSRLNELRQGKWEGMKVSEVRSLYPDLYSRWEKDPTLVKPPGGESVSEAFQRVKSFWVENILPQKGRGVIVAHKVINALIKSVLEKDSSLNLLWRKLPENAQVERFSL